MTNAKRWSILTPANGYEGGWMTQFHNFEHMDVRAKLVPCGWRRGWILQGLPYRTGDKLTVRFHRGKTIPPSDQRPLDQRKWGYRLELLQGDTVVVDTGAPIRGTVVPRLFTFGRLSYPGHYTIDYIALKGDEQSHRIEERTRAIASIQVVPDYWVWVVVLFIGISAGGFVTNKIIEWLFNVVKGLLDSPMKPI